MFKMVLEIQSAHPVSFLDLGALVVFKLAQAYLVPCGVEGHGGAPSPAPSQGQEIQLMAENLAPDVEAAQQGLAGEDAREESSRALLSAACG